MKKSKKPAKRPKRGRAMLPKREANLNSQWQTCWRSMQRIIRRNISGHDGIRESQDEAWTADCIAQSYFMALRRAVPDEPEKPVLYGIPLNLSERILFTHIERLNDMLCQLTRASRWHACQVLWDQSVKLINTFSEVALTYPDPFRSRARLALAMPSLRVPPTLRKSKNGRAKWTDPFLGNAPKIAEAIELSADTVGAKLSDNRGRLGALCAHLVAACVHEIKRARALWAHLFTPYQREVVWPTREQIEPFRGKTADELLATFRPERTEASSDEIEKHLRFFCLLAECGAERLDFLLLKDLTRDEAGHWWKNAIEKMTEKRFPALLRLPVWREELKKVSSGTHAGMRKELKDYCRDKVKQFA